MQSLRVRFLQKLNDEQGAELVEYVAIFPLIILVTLIVWQAALVGYTGVVAASAAREGARAAAVAEDCYAAARRASRPWSDARRQIRCQTGGEVVTATVDLEIPKTQFPLLSWLPDYPRISVTATMRYEPPYHATW